MAAMTNGARITENEHLGDNLIDVFLNDGDDDNAKCLELKKPSHLSW